jgi:hypothetical protein
MVSRHDRHAVCELLHPLLLVQTDHTLYKAHGSGSNGRDSSLTVSKGGGV